MKTPQELAYKYAHHSGLYMYSEIIYTDFLAGYRAGVEQCAARLAEEAALRALLDAEGKEGK